MPVHHESHEQDDHGRGTVVVNVHLDLGDLITALNTTNRKLGTIMADLNALTAAVDALVASEGAAATELQHLADEVATLTAGSVTQEQIDSVTSKVTAVADALNAAVTDAEGDANPPVEPPQ